MSEQLSSGIYFVRHGETTANVGLAMEYNPQLTAHGTTQALEAGVRLSNLQPVAIIHTGLDRTKETAMLIQLGGNFSEVPVFEMPNFAERQYGVYSGQGAMKAIRAQNGMEERFEQFGPSCVWFLAGDSEKGVESVEHMRERILTGLMKVKKKFGENPIIIVAHEGSIKMVELIYQHIEQGLPERLARRRIVNCEVLNLQETC